MTDDRERLKDIIEMNLPQIEIVTLKDLVQNITKVSNVRVRTKSVTQYHEIGIDSINDEGILTIPANPKKYASANESAIKSQRLHRGDLIFGYRGKMGAVGLVEKEFNTPVVTNNGMMRITFSKDRIEETPRYVQTYLQTNLIRTYLNKMLDNSKLSVKTLIELPIPVFEEHMGISKFSTLFYRRRQMTLESRKIVTEANELLKLRENMESETVSLQVLSFEELDQINRDDHKIQNMLQDLRTQLQQLKHTKISDSFLLQEFPKE